MLLVELIGRKVRVLTGRGAITGTLERCMQNPSEYFVEFEWCGNKADVQFKQENVRDIAVRSDVVVLWINDDN